MKGREQVVGRGQLAPPHQLGVLGSAVSSPGGSGAETQPKLNVVHFNKKSGFWWLQMTDIFTAQACVYSCTNSFRTALLRVFVRVCMSQQINKSYNVTDFLFSYINLGYFSFLTLWSIFFSHLSPRICPHTTPTSKILADNGYKNSATNYKEIKLSWISCCCWVKLQCHLRITAADYCGRIYRMSPGAQIFGART